MTTLLSEFRRVGKWATISTIRHLIRRQGVLDSESPHEITPNGWSMCRTRAPLAMSSLVDRANGGKIANANDPTGALAWLNICQLCWVRGRAPPLPATFHRRLTQRSSRTFTGQLVYSTPPPLVVTAKGIA